jgi:acetoin utilization protein AcuB
MTKPIPKIRAHMTPTPHSIGRDQPLTRAHALMREYQIRHLPVLDGGVLVGLLSDRDLHLIETLRDVDPERVSVEEAMSPIVYAVGPDAPLDQVLDEMAKHKYGCAVVMQQQQVIGIFTTSDVCRTLAALLRGH